MVLSAPRITKDLTRLGHSTAPRNPQKPQKLLFLPGQVSAQQKDPTQASPVTRVPGPQLYLSIDSLEWPSKQCAISIIGIGDREGSELHSVGGGRWLGCFWC